MSNCQCGELKLDGRGTGSFNWNPDCNDHGTSSEWYTSDEQVTKRAADRARLRELQLKAAELRRQYRD